MRRVTASGRWALNAISVIPPISQQNALHWQIIVHDQIKPKIVGGLPSGDLGSHGQSGAIVQEVDLGRETTA